MDTYRYRSSRGQQWRRSPGVVSSSPRQPSQPSRMKVGLGNKLGSVDRLITEEQEEKVQIEDFTPLASYNWLENAAVPTIVVPGGPPIWTPPKGSFSTSPDTGLSYVDQDSALLPQSPMEPMLRSIMLMKPDFEFTSVDVVTSRNNLRKLLRFVGNEGTLTAFRIDAELVGQTMALTRWEDVQVEHSDTRFHGYSTNFKNRCTNIVCSNTTSNHRSASYSLGGLRFLVGFHVDAQLELDADLEDEDHEDEDDHQSDEGQSDDDDDALVAAFDRLSVGRQQVQATNSQDVVHQFLDSTLHYIRSGAMPPQDSLIELHTRSAWKEFDYFDFYSQMCLSHTGHLVVARHSKGYFDMPAERTSRDGRKFTQHKQRLESSLHQVVVVLKKMKEIMQKAAGKPVAFIFESGRSTLDAFVTASGDSKTLAPSLNALFATTDEESTAE